MKKDKTWPKSWLNILLVALSFAVFISCGSGPKIEICILGPELASCSDPRLPREKQDYQKTQLEITNYVSTNAQDYNTLVNRKCETVSIEICILSDDGHGECFDERKPPGYDSYPRTPAQMLNYVATNVNDYNYLLNYLEQECQNGPRQ